MKMGKYQIFDVSHAFFHFPHIKSCATLFPQTFDTGAATMPDYHKKRVIHI